MIVDVSVNNGPSTVWRIPSKTQVLVGQVEGQPRKIDIAAQVFTKVQLQ